MPGCGNTDLVRSRESIHVSFRWFGVAFVLISLVGVSACFTQVPEVDEASLYVRNIEGNVFDTAPVRGELQPLRYRRGSYEWRCNECHDDFQNRPTAGHPEGEHAAIVKNYDHGLNTLCQNCHHPENREVYIDYEGGEILPTQPAKLCAKCHGPTYRDWQAGVHGRQNGHWDRNAGPRTKLLCIQCHDPHHPKFAPMAPDAAPDYSRLQAQQGEAH